jgi:hypothetical protein
MKINLLLINPNHRNLDSSVGTATIYGQPGFDSWLRNYFFYSAAFRSTLVPAQPPIQWVQSDNGLKLIIRLHLGRGQEW